MFLVIFKTYEVLSQIVLKLIELTDSFRRPRPSVRPPSLKTKTENKNKKQTKKIIKKIKKLSKIIG